MLGPLSLALALSTFSGCSTTPTPVVAPVEAEPLSAPDALTALSFGQPFIHSSWGTDITQEQVDKMGEIAMTAHTRGSDLQATVETARLTLVRGLITGDDPVPLIQAMTDAERAAVESDVDAVIELTQVITIDQWVKRAKKGGPRFLVDASVGSSTVMAKNPFENLTDTKFTDAEIKLVLTNKFDAAIALVDVRNASTKAMAGIGKLDLTNPEWSTEYRTISKTYLDSWVPARMSTATQAANFFLQLPAATRERLAYDRALELAFAPMRAPSRTGGGSEFGGSGGEGQMGGAGTTGMGGQGGMGMQGTSGMGGQGGMGMQGTTGMSGQGGMGMQGTSGMGGQGGMGMQGTTGMSGQGGMGMQGTSGMGGQGGMGMQGTTGMGGQGGMGMQGTTGMSGQGGMGMQGTSGMGGQGGMGMQGTTGMGGQSGMGMQGTTGMGMQGTTGMGMQGTTIVPGGTTGGK